MGYRMTKPITIVTGGQYGSEAKGTIAAHIVRRDRITHAVRTGATNAGHTCEYRGKRYAMQQIPVAWVDPNVKLILGAGAFIDPEILNREITMIREAEGTQVGDRADIVSRLTIDYRAYLHLPRHHERADKANRHHSIGATGKGCSEAVVDRIRLRGKEDLSVRTNPNLINSAIHIQDTELYLNGAWNNGAAIMLEGCQGTLLDMVLGPYPYTTHKQTTPATWMAECGLSPALPTHIVMVCRTMPIRVAGNSGPLPREISWLQLARGLNYDRESNDQAPIVSNDALDVFEAELRTVTKRWVGNVPHGSDGTDQHRWSETDRQRHQAALSELHKETLNSLPTEIVTELRNLFEMTTVTKKLRRIASFDYESFCTAVRQVRPHELSFTFMNYVVPENWGMNRKLQITDRERLWLNMNVTPYCAAPVRTINRGADADCVIDVT